MFICDKAVAMVAIPDRRGGFLDFWRLEVDRGQDLPWYGAFRFKWTHAKRDAIVADLKARKKTYLQDMDYLRKQRQVVAYAKDRQLDRLYRSVRKTNEMLATADRIVSL